jgi:capsular exopolysaccharide synthesis family protein
MEFRSFLPILRAHWIAIVVFVLVGGAGAFGWSLLQPKVYSADSSGYLSAGDNSDTGNALVGDNLAQSKVKSYIDIGTSRAVAQYAIDELGLKVAPEQLVTRTTVSNPNGTVLIKVSATGSTPTAARDLAESWLRGIAQQIKTIEGTDASGATTTGVVQLIPLDSAVLPTSPTSPNTRLAIVIGLIAGLVVGLAYAALRHALDRRIRTADAVEREFGISVIGTVPIDRRFTDSERLVSMDGATDYSQRDDDDVAVAEALREIRTNLQFMDVDSPPRVMVVTSPLPGDGKSTLVANLAIALAAGHQPVVLIDADLRRPTVSKTFNLVDGAGLTDVLAGRSAVEDVLQPWGNSGRLFVLTAGKIPPNPSELLGSERMHTLLKDLSEQAIVLIDAPPLIPVTDAAVLSHNTDGALVVAGVGKTTFEGLSKALQNLKRANGRPLGIILNRMPRRGVGSGYGYGYGYGSTYQTRPTEEESPEVEESPAPIASAGPASQDSGPEETALTPAEMSDFDALLMPDGPYDLDDVQDDRPSRSFGEDAVVGSGRTPTRREMRDRLRKST